MCGFSHKTLSSSPYGTQRTALPTSYGFIEPHNTLSISTIGKWVKAVLANAGIDITKFLWEKR